MSASAPLAFLIGTAFGVAVGLWLALSPRPITSGGSRRRNSRALGNESTRA
jgi:hypothetical protein